LDDSDARRIEFFDATGSENQRASNDGGFVFHYYPSRGVTVAVDSGDGQEAGSKRARTVILNLSLPERAGASQR
jgi:hypothetical protein